MRGMHPLFQCMITAYPLEANTDPIEAIVRIPQIVVLEDNNLQRILAHVNMQYIKVLTG